MRTSLPITIVPVRSLITTRADRSVSTVMVSSSAMNSTGTYCLGTSTLISAEFSARATRSYLDARYDRGEWLVFGSETKGLPPELLARYAEQAYVIPISSPHVRSLNLSNAVSIVVYEALRQMSVRS